MSVIGTHAFWHVQRTPRIARLIVLNNALLFACVSMYFGTGWSLVLFSFPIEPQLTPDNYYLQFVPQVTAATQFFTYMTSLMLVLALIMSVAEWGRPLRWLPVVVMLAIIAPTLLTTSIILPLNAELARGITDPAELKDILGRWMVLNEVRVSMWTVQWLCMIAYFAIKALPSEEAA